MTDTTFERRAALLTNDGYFDRVRELMQECNMPQEQAWDTVEKDLPFGLRRFTSYLSFLNAKKLESEGRLPKPQFKG